MSKTQTIPKRSGHRSGASEMHATCSLTEFDEGPLPADWVGELEKRGTVVKRYILREDARAVFLRYRELGGDAY
jgi:hypothetical protein